MKTLIVLVAALVCAHSFTIPLLFGGISVNKGPDGNVGIGFKNAINVNGNGFDRNTNFNVGKGKFDVQDQADILVDGKRSGPRSSLGVGDDGFNIGSGIAITEGPKVSR